jgi:excisionase family DNA binding protein
MAWPASFGGAWAIVAGWCNKSAPPSRHDHRSAGKEAKFMSNKFLQISQVSDLLEISETTARRLVKKGVLPAIRVGRQIRIDERRFQEWLDGGGSAPLRSHAIDA